MPEQRIKKYVDVVAEFGMTDSNSTSPTSQKYSHANTANAEGLE